MEKAIRIDDADSVAVALSGLDVGEWALGVEILERVPAGHKFALRAHGSGENIIKYGYPIGHAIREIRPGEWVHTHNALTNLSGELLYQFERAPVAECAPFEGVFDGYMRADGRVGIRNEIWIIPMVSCVNKTAERLARMATEALSDQTDGVFAYPHPYGCSQVGEDLLRTQKLLAAMVRHPNAGGVLVLGLGCENNTMESFRDLLGDVDERRVKFLLAQEVEDEVEAGMSMLSEISMEMRGDKRSPQPLSKIVIGLKCGGSDGFSGITANPLLGVFSDGLCAAGGTALMTEVPEMFGAETILMNRCETEELFEKTVEMINRYKRYFLRYGEAVSDNPSPGNKDGGLTTLEDKSLGCTQKGGRGPVRGVLDYAELVSERGLNLVYGPGNDGCAITALMAAGAQMILFSTGRGTPMGSSVPTIKISTNSTLARKKPNWIDFDAGALLGGLSMEEAVRSLLRLTLEVAGGRLARNEINGDREIAIFKDGVTE